LITTGNQLIQYTDFYTSNGRKPKNFTFEKPDNSVKQSGTSGNDGDDSDSDFDDDNDDRGGHTRRVSNFDSVRMLRDDSRDDCGDDSDNSSGYGSHFSDTEDHSVTHDALADNDNGSYAEDSSVKLAKVHDEHADDYSGTVQHEDIRDEPVGTKKKKDQKKTDETEGVKESKERVIMEEQEKVGKEYEKKVAVLAKKRRVLNEASRVGRKGKYNEGFKESKDRVILEE